MLAAVVPVKSLSQTKGRLAELLTPGERSRLSLAMLADVLAALRSSGAADLLAVTSPDPEVAAAAGAAGAEFWPDTAGSQNGAVAAALARAAAAGATAALVLPGDVPLVTPDDVCSLLAQAPAEHGAVVAPTGDGGTGALLLRPPTLIAPDYGGASAARHLAAARAAGAAALLYPLPHLALDLDRPEDLRAFLQQAAAGATRACLAGFDRPARAV